MAGILGFFFFFNAFSKTILLNFHSIFDKKLLFFQSKKSLKIIPFFYSAKNWLILLAVYMAKLI